MVESLFQLQNSDGYESSGSGVSGTSGVQQPNGGAMIAQNVPAARPHVNDQSQPWVGISSGADRASESKERTVKFIANVRAKVQRIIESEISNNTRAAMRSRVSRIAKETSHCCRRYGQIIVWCHCSHKLAAAENL